MIRSKIQRGQEKDIRNYSKWSEKPFGTLNRRATLIHILKRSFRLSYGGFNRKSKCKIKRMNLKTTAEVGKRLYNVLGSGEVKIETVGRILGLFKMRS